MELGLQPICPKAELSVVSREEWDEDVQKFVGAAGDHRGQSAVSMMFVGNAVPGTQAAGDGWSDFTP